MLSALMIGGTSTYGLYKGVVYLNSTKKIDFETYLRFEDVRSTIITVNKYLRKNDAENKTELSKQFKLIKRLLHDIDQLTTWRKAKYMRYFAWTGEENLIHQFQDEWIIFKVRIRVISGLNSLESNGL